MIFCKALNESFSTQKDMFAALIKRKDEVIALKKSDIKNTDGAAYVVKAPGAIKEAYVDTLSIGDTVSNVINTTYFLDSHDDLHVDGIWDKSANEQNGKTYHVADHLLSLGSIVGYPKDVSIEVRVMKWRELGIDADGQTQALIFHTKMTDKTNPDAFKAYRDNEPVQHSVRMQYVTISLAINDEEFEKEKALFDTYLPKILNKDKALENGYFWVVSEAKIYKEGSTVLFGSNEITPPLGRKTQEITQPPLSTEPVWTKEHLDVLENFKLNS